MIEAPSHFSITVGDLDRSIAFYRDVMGMEIERRLESRSKGISQMTGLDNVLMNVCFMRKGTARVELTEYVRPKGKRQPLHNNDIGASHIGFIANDIDRDYQWLLDHGVRCMSPLVTHETGRKALYFYDPDGNILELVEPGVPGQKKA